MHVCIYIFTYVCLTQLICLPSALFVAHCLPHLNNNTQFECVQKDIFYFILFYFQLILFILYNTNAMAEYLHVCVCVCKNNKRYLQLSNGTRMVGDVCTSN